IKETGYVAQVIETFIKFGAAPEIAYLNKPHLGTDQLCRIIKNIREFILASGGEINFQSRVTDLIIEKDILKGIVINGQQKCFGGIFVFAIGHSARDTLQMFKNRGVNLEQKPFAVGVRLEHPAEIINLMQYGRKYQHHEKLGAADYALTHQGVFSFCMCPGGEIVNASSENKRLVLNGMSNSARSSLFSNAAIVAPVTPDDLSCADPLAGLEFQQMIEAKAFNNWQAPAQNLLDFLSSTKSAKIKPNSFKMGTFSADIAEILPKFISAKLVAAFKHWQARFPLFVSDQAVMLAPETRTSSPVKIVRDDQRRAVGLANFYPVGEGSGYSGGITSSAVDAIKTVEVLCY
ncbi:MAG: dehydrogenase, partial [Candidatus Margulisbacteria bacterium]|nr:dehydrogenase [Candidatus Margulisiibacteriota bacterium]